MEVVPVCNITAHLKLLHGEPDLHVGPVTKGPAASRQARIWRASLAGIGRPDRKTTQIWVGSTEIG
jgi:hypothetical protein